MTGEHFDVLIVGAGLSGIGAACRLRTRCPGSSFAILEARDDLGGTWDLFRYPGVRSDSEMFTLSYSFRPWTHAAAIAGGRTILTYIRDTATRVRRRSPNPLRPQGALGGMVVGRGALDPGGRSAGRSGGRSN